MIEANNETRRLRKLQVIKQQTENRKAKNA